MRASWNVSRRRIRVRVRNQNRNGRARADLANNRLLRLSKLKSIDNACHASLDPEKPLPIETLGVIEERNDLGF